MGKTKVHFTQSLKKNLSKCSKRHILDRDPDPSGAERELGFRFNSLPGNIPLLKLPTYPPNSGLHTSSPLGPFLNRNSLSKR